MKIPLIGLGTWELRGKKCIEVVKMALEIGYRHIDTAHMYENHTEIGQGIKSFPRDKLFITSKFLTSQMLFETVEESCERALYELGTDYLDLYLLHYPDRDAPLNEILQELENLKKKKMVREVGVSNFTIRHLKESPIHPAYNQVEFHPYLFQKKLLDYCEEHQIQLISYRTLGKGTLLKDPTVVAIASAHAKSPAQILLRWCVERGIPVIPKASSRRHLEENFDLNFRLSKEEMNLLDSLSKNLRFCDSALGDFDYE